MKKGCLISIIVVASLALIVLSVVLWGTKAYNGMVTMQEAVTSQWGNVETSYQRRSDLIPNFVNTVKGAANFEQTTLTQVIEARSKATSVTIDPTKMTAENMQQFQQAQGKVYDVLGNEVAILVNEVKPPGSYSINFDLKGKTAGVYYYRLQAGKFIQTKKLILQK